MFAASFQSSLNCKKVGQIFEVKTVIWNMSKTDTCMRTRIMNLCIDLNKSSNDDDEGWVAVRCIDGRFAYDWPQLKVKYLLDFNIHVN